MSITRRVAAVTSVSLLIAYHVLDSEPHLDTPSYPLPEFSRNIVVASGTFESLGIGTIAPDAGSPTL